MMPFTEMGTGASMHLYNGEKLQMHRLHTQRHIIQLLVASDPLLFFFFSFFSLLVLAILQGLPDERVL